MSLIYFRGREIVRKRGRELSYALIHSLKCPGPGASLVLSREVDRQGHTIACYLPESTLAGSSCWAQKLHQASN